MAKYNLFKKVIKDTAIFATVLVCTVGAMPTAFAKAEDGATWADFQFQFSSVGDQDYTAYLYKSSNDYLTMKCTYTDVPGAVYKAYGIGESSGKTSEIKEFYEGKWDLLGNDICGEYVHMHGELLDDEGWDGSYADGYWHSDSGIAQ